MVVYEMLIYPMENYTEYEFIYYKALFSPNVDACIFHVQNEGQPGFIFGFESQALDVYKYMDTPEYAEHVNAYLPVIGGATSWESIIPGFDATVLENMPNR